MLDQSYLASGLSVLLLGSVSSAVKENANRLSLIPAPSNAMESQTRADVIELASEPLLLLFELNVVLFSRGILDIIKI